MATRTLLDTDIWSEILKAKDPIVATRSRRFLALLARAEVLWLDPTIAELAGRIRADLERMGNKLTIEDTLIAATGIRHGLPVATGNTRHLIKIQEAGYPLVLENWREPLS